MHNSIVVKLKKEPKGINWLRSIFLNSINPIPTIEPRIEDKIIIFIVDGRPIQNPIIAIILTSPIPMPSLLRINKYIFVKTNLKYYLYF